MKYKERLTAILHVYQQSHPERDTSEEEEQIGRALQEVVRLSVLLRNWSRVTALCDTLLQQGQVTSSSITDGTATTGVSGVSLPQHLSSALFHRYVLPALSSFLTTNNNTTFHNNKHNAAHNYSYSVTGETLEMVENLVAALRAAL